MDPTTVGLIGLAILIIFLFSRMPVAFVMGLLGVVGFSYVVSFEGGMRMLAKDFFDIFGSYSLTVVPLFMLMGQITFHAGISSRLFDTAYKLIGHYPGGLAMAAVAACAGFAAICGSTNAAAATMGTVALPEMKRYK
ncbi:MAG TPA: TRAP transporter large permease subunit, partial [Desulfobacteraceae bacterium]|nr:TRAP transporter large permease subunit [Desulfobacteraceae bacterium]